MYTNKVTNSQVLVNEKELVQKIQKVYLIFQLNKIVKVIDMVIRTKKNTFSVRDKSGMKSCFPKGTILKEILDYQRPPDMKTIVLAKVNNRIHDLWRNQRDDCLIEWISVQTPEGIRSYQYTLCWILIKVMAELYPSKKLLIDHSLGKGLYCEWKDSKPIDLKKGMLIRKRMQETILRDEILKPHIVHRKEAYQFFLASNENLDLFIKNKNRSTLRLYPMRDTYVYTGYPLFPSTGYLRAFDLRPYKPGIILRFPDLSDVLILPPFMKPQKLFQVFQEFGHWEEILGIQKINDINTSISDKNISDLIKICEGLHEKRISQIADSIERKKNVRVILISGPSSSGKTTFTKRLSIQLRVNGLRPLAVSLDHYFLTRDKTPKNEDGNPDFESPMAIDIRRLNRDLISLLNGETVRLPHYDFKTGRRSKGSEYTLDKNQPILIEGIHALNDQLTPALPEKYKFKIYVSALTQLNITDYLRIHTSDIRLLRRLVRDYQFRGHSPEYTLENWQAVREGEETHIFPFQEEAAAIFNTALPYELSILKTFTKPLLEKIPQHHPTFTEANRFLELLMHVQAISPDEVPSNSILREFIGHSSFDY